VGLALKALVATLIQDQKSTKKGGGGGEVRNATICRFARHTWGGQSGAGGEMGVSVLLRKEKSLKQIEHHIIRRRADDGN